MSTAPRSINSTRRRQIKRSLAGRDGMACFYCRTPFADASEATIDHLVPQSAIPGWKLANLVLACQPCNAAKADTLPQALLRPAGYGPGLVPLQPAAEVTVGERTPVSAPDASPPLVRAFMSALRTSVSARVSLPLSARVSALLSARVSGLRRTLVPAVRLSEVRS